MSQIVMANVITQSAVAVRSSTNPRPDPSRRLSQPPIYRTLAEGLGALDHPGSADMIQLSAQPPF